MKKRVFNILLIGVLLLSTLFTGCKASDKDDTKVQNEGPWYKTNYVDIMVDENEYISMPQLVGDSVYFLKTKWSEEADQSSFEVLKMKLEDSSIVEFPIVLEKDYYVMDMYATDSGIFIASQFMKWDKDYTKMLEAEYVIFQYDLEGNLVNTLELTDSLSAKNTENNAVYMSSIACDNEGNIYVSDANSFISVFDTAGNQIADIEKEGWGNGLIAGTDGTVYYSYMDEASWEEIVVAIDVEGNKLGEEIGVIPENSNYSDIQINEAGQIYTTIENKLILCDLTTDEQTELFYWLDYDINGDDVRYVTKMEDGTIFAFCENYSGEETTYEVVTMVETDEPLPQKTTLTYTTIGLSSEIADAIIRFNKNNDTYRIQVVDYYDNDDYMTGLEAYNEAILNGEMGDILTISLDTYKGYARQGLYADLNEFMDSDADIDRADYFENVLKAYEVEGKLYAIPTTFGVSTLVGKASIWGDVDSLTTSAITEAIKTAGNDAELMDYMTKSQWLWVALQAGMDNYINWETGECSFDSEQFIATLELANQFPMEDSWQEGEVSTPIKIQENKVLLNSEYFTEIESFQVAKAIFNEDITFLGYPDAANGGNLITETDTILAISADSEYKEGAWEFLKYLISEEYQCNYVRWFNPIHRTAFEKQMERAKEITTYIDENGEEVETPHTTYGWEDFEISVYHATDADVAEYTELLESATTLVFYEEEIMEIINEEVAPFFEGQKTAKEVAGIIQGRINIYVNENR